MVSQAARVAIVTHTIATIAPPLVASFALVLGRLVPITRFLALRMLSLGRGGAT